MRRNDLLRGVYDIMILSCVKKYNGELNKYRLKKCIDDIVGNNYRINDSTIYDAVRRLNVNGYINQNSDNFLIISDDGKEHLKELVEEWETLTQVIKSFI